MPRAAATPRAGSADAGGGHARARGRWRTCARAGRGQLFQRLPQAVHSAGVLEVAADRHRAADQTGHAPRPWLSASSISRSTVVERAAAAGRTAAPAAGRASITGGSSSARHQTFLKTPTTRPRTSHVTAADRLHRRVLGLQANVVASRGRSASRSPRRPSSATTMSPSPARVLAVAPPRSRRPGCRRRACSRRTPGARTRPRRRRRRAGPGRSPRCSPRPAPAGRRRPGRRAAAPSSGVDGLLGLVEQQLDRPRLGRVAPQHPVLLEVREVGVHGRRGGEADGLPDLADRRRIAVLGRVPLDELEDLLLALGHLQVHHRLKPPVLVGARLCVKRANTCS